MQGQVMALIENKEEKCRAIQKRIEQGQGVCESCREIGVSEKTFYRWRRAGEDTCKG
ncbi:transposase [uncultured Parasphingorhabdus sp.]|uniref:transposase n=1 Tax=uncultured Parasphingorhabdus sp. TaxID=2709694 RepID=UPI0030DAE1A4|tara:strand:- start:3722 stop:3892 length:171 start_codon:yes stop_codon:yes gene_type:complete